MKLVEMAPRGDLTSTEYALANPGKEYLVLQPSETADSFTVMLEAGANSVEWVNVNSLERKESGEVTVEGDGSSRFAAPFAVVGPAMLYLKRVGR